MSVYRMPEQTPAELFAETMVGHLEADVLNAYFYATKGTLS